MIKFEKLTPKEAEEIEKKCANTIEFEFSDSNCTRVRVNTPAGVVQIRYKDYGIAIEKEVTKKVYVLEYKEKVTKGFETKLINIREEFESEEARQDYINSKVDPEDYDTMIKTEYDEISAGF